MASLIFLLAAPALAQPADCEAIPLGPPMHVQVYVGATAPSIAQPGTATARVTLPALPSRGTLCVAPPPAATDILGGPPAPTGLLRNPEMHPSPPDSPK